MREPDLIRRRIEEQLDKFSNTQRNVIEILLKRPTEVLMLGLDDFAQVTGTSRSTVLRVAQKLGFSGYRELQQHALAFVEQPKHSNDPLMTWLTQSSRSVMQEAIATLEVPKINEVAQRLSKATLLVWFGIGESGFLAEIANHKCWFLGINSRACTETVNFESFSNTLNESQALIVISRTGTGHHIEKPLAMAQAKGAYTVGISSGHLSRLAQHASTCLFAPTEDVMMTGQRISIRAGHELVINSLILRLAQILEIPFEIANQTD